MAATASDPPSAGTRQLQSACPTLPLRGLSSLPPDRSVPPLSVRISQAYSCRTPSCITHLLLGEGITGNGFPGILAKLIGRRIPDRQKDMEGDEHAGETHGCEDIEEEDDVDDQITHFLWQLETREGDDDLYEDQEGEEAGSGDEDEEVTVIALPYTGADPGTVVVEPFHADVAVVAVGGPGWPVNVAGVAEFHPQAMSLDRHRVDLLQVTHYPVLVLTIQWNPTQLLVLVARQDFGNHAWVGEAEGKQCQLDGDVKQDREDDQSYWSFEGSDDVVEESSQPKQDMRAYIFFRF